MRQKKLKQALAAVLSATMVFTMTPSALYASEVTVEESAAEASVAEVQAVEAPEELQGDDEVSDSCLITINRNFSAGTSAKVYYTTCLDGEEIALGEPAGSTSCSTSIPKYSTLWIKDVSMTDKVLQYSVTTSLGETLSSNGIYAQSTEPVEVLHSVEQALSLTITDYSACRMDISFDESSSTVQADDFTMYRSDGSEIKNGELTREGDSITISCNKTLASDERVAVWKDQYVTQYISPKHSSVTTTINQSNHTIFIKQKDTHEVTFDFPESYREHLKLYYDYNRTEEIEDGDAISPDENIYVGYDGFSVDSVLKIRLSVISSQGSESCTLKTGEQSAVRILTMPAEDCRITVSELQSMMVSVSVNNTGFQIYTDNTFSTPVTDTLEYFEGDSIYYSIPDTSPVRYDYTLQIGYVNGGCAKYRIDSDDRRGSIHPGGSGGFRIEVIAKKVNGVTISNNYADKVQFYQDSECTELFNSGDYYSGTLYAKLISDIGEDEYIYIKNSYSSNRYLLNEAPLCGIYVGDNTNIQVEKRTKNILSYDFGECSELIHLYYDQAHTKEVVSGSTYTPGTYVYAVLSSAAEESKDYSILLQRKDAYSTSAKFKANQNELAIWLSDDKDLSLSFAGTADRLTNHIEIEDGYGAYVGVYYNSACTEVIPANGYISKGQAVYIKQNANLSDAGKALRIRIDGDGTKENIGYQYLTSGNETYFYLYNENYEVKVETYDKPVVHITLDTEYEGKIKFYSDSSASSELVDGAVIGRNSEIYARLTPAGAGMSIPVHMDGAEPNNYGEDMNNCILSNCVSVDDESGIVKLGRAHDSDVTLTARNKYHLQIVEEDSAAAFTKHYEIAKNGGEFETLSDTDCWVPFGSKLRIHAEGMDEDYVLQTSIWALGAKGYYRRGNRQVAYTAEDSIIIDLNRETPIYIEGVSTTPVKIDDTVPDSENFVSYTYGNGKTLHDGDKLVSGETIAISIKGAPEKTAIHTSGISKYAPDEEGWVDSNRNERYFLYGQEASADFNFTVADHDTVITSKLLPLHKVTVHKPQGYEVEVSWGYYDPEEGDECRFYYDFASSESEYLVPEGAQLRFACYDGIQNLVNALKVTDTGSTAALGYIYSDEYNTSVQIAETDRDFTLSPVSVYKIIPDNQTELFGKLYRAYDWDENDDWVSRGIYAAEGEAITIYKEGIPVSKVYTVNVSGSNDSTQKVLENELLSYTKKNAEFLMPTFPVTVKVTEGEQNKYVVNIKENNFTEGSAASYRKYVSSTETEKLQDGDEVYADQLIRVEADSVAANKKMLVTIKETGTNQYASGSSHGTLLEGIQSLLLKMLNRPITIEVTQKDRKGTGNAVGINENISSSTVISYSVENGDLVPKGGEVILNVSNLSTGKHVHMNVVCPDENMVATGPGIENDFSKPYFSKEITQTGEIKFTMPDYPVLINVWEDTIDNTKVDLSSASVELVNSELKFTGKEIIPEYTVKLNGLELIKNINYTESLKDNSNAGTATLIITGMGGYSGTVEKTFTILQRSLADAEISVAMADKVIYNYKPKYEPKPVIRLGEYLLNEGSDYSLSYENNTEPTERAVVTITGMGNFNETLNRNFAIVTEKQDLKDAQIKISGSEYEYTGEKITPDIAVICNHEQLEAGIDYEVSYLDNVNAGTAAVKISGLGNYTGSCKAEFTIAARKLESEQFKAAVANQKYKKKISEYKPEPIVTYGGIAMVPGVDYTLQYAGNTGEAAEASVTITGIHNYEGTKVLTFSIAKDLFDAASMKISTEDSKFVYNGKEKRPVVTVVYKGEKLTEGTDFEAIYKDNVNAGTAKIIISGIGEYAGSKTKTFKITPKELADTADYEVESIPDQEYNGMNCPTPAVTDTKTGELLTLQDISYTYKNNKKINDNAVLKIKGTGNYKGTISKTFKITPLSFDAYAYSIDDCSYTGSKVKPDIIATNLATGERTLLKTGVALKVVFSNNTEITDTAKAVISPKNKRFFTMKEGEDATKEITFSIVKCNLEDVTINPVKDQKYNRGKEIKPRLVVKLGTAKLKLTRQYKIIYKDNKEKGYGTATIVPADEKHFTGSQTIKFVIK